MTQTQKESLSRRFLKWLCKTLGVILALMLTFTLAFRYLAVPAWHSAFGTGSLQHSLSGFSGIGQNTSLPDSPHPMIGGPDSGVVNILLIGQDRREGEAHSRSDTLILCSFQEQSKTLIMTSFLRDLYVTIPGHGANRINAAYSLGGMPLLRQTLSENFGLYLDGCVEVDFAQFSDIINALGGVQIRLRSDEAALINQETGSSLTEGDQRLDGAQALAYSRIRSLDSDGDFSRTARQRKVLSSLLDSFRSASFPDLISTATRLLPLITTDMDPARILKCALEVVPHLSGIETTSQRIPADGTYTDRQIDGMWVLDADLEQARSLLRNTLQKK